jgi:hypothetical protein
MGKSNKCINDIQNLLLIGILCNVLSVFESRCSENQFVESGPFRVGEVISYQGCLSFELRQPIGIRSDKSIGCKTSFDLSFPLLHECEKIPSPVLNPYLFLAFTDKMVRPQGDGNSTGGGDKPSKKSEENLLVEEVQILISIDRWLRYRFWA